MRFADWCAASAGALFIAGLLPAIAVQAELAAPGLTLFARSAGPLFQALLALHGGLYAISLPLAFAALGFALAGERMPMWAAMARLTLGACVLSAFASGASAIGARSMARAVIDASVFWVACGLLSVAILVAISVTSSRVVAIIFAAFSVLALLLAVLFNVVLINSGVDTSLHDTYFVVAAIHAAGLAVVLDALAILSAYVIRSTSSPGIWFAIVFGVLIFFSGTASDAVTMQLGLLGQPREVIDYNAAFAVDHRALTIYSAAFAVITTCAFGFLAFLRMTRPPKATESDAFA